MTNTTLTGQRVWPSSLARWGTLTKVLTENVYDLPLASGVCLQGYSDDGTFRRVLSNYLDGILEAQSLSELRDALGETISELGLRLIHGTETFNNCVSELQVWAAIEIGNTAWPGEAIYWTSESWARNLSSCMWVRQSTYLNLLSKADRGEAVDAEAVDRALLGLLADLVRKLAVLEDMYPEELDSEGAINPFPPLD
jgi:hypothetical protein